MLFVRTTVLIASYVSIDCITPQIVRFKSCMWCVAFCLTFCLMVKFMKTWHLLETAQYFFWFRAWAEVLNCGWCCPLDKSPTRFRSLFCELSHLWTVLSTLSKTWACSIQIGSVLIICFVFQTWRPEESLCEAGSRLWCFGCCQQGLCCKTRVLHWRYFVILVNFAELFVCFWLD